MPAGSPLVADLDLRSVLEVARRRWPVLLGLAILIPAISVLLVLRQPPRYSASSEVLVKRQNIAASLTPGQVPYTDAQTAERVIETQVQLARVPDLAQRVVVAAGQPGGKSADDLLASSSVTAKPKSDILVFTVEAPSRPEARALAGLYADQFTTYRRELDTTELDALSASVRNQLATLDVRDERTAPLRNDLQDKLRQIQTLQAIQTSSAVVVRRPDGATRTGPTPLTMGTGGLLLGLLLGGGLAFLLETLDTRVRRSSEIAEILGLPLLARLPEPPDRLRKRSGLVVLEEPESPAAEGFAFLRTNLTFANMASGAKVIMFCSAVEQEGKSTTISNLAVALARAGSRVVLVDVDYRRPTIHSFFSVPRLPGVTEVVGGKADLDGALRRVSIPHDATGSAPGEGSHEPELHVLPSGGVIHGIDVDHVVDVLDRLRDGADLVLVDAPPLLLVGEALALSARMDGLVVVTRLDHIRRPMLEELRRAFDAAPVRPLGFVATAAAKEAGYPHYYRRKAYPSLADDGEAGGPATDGPPPLAAGPAREPTAQPAAVVPPANGAVDARRALIAAIVADRGAAVPGVPDPGTGSDGAPGVRPRRSWAQHVRNGSSTVAEPSIPQKRTEGGGGGADG